MCSSDLVHVAGEAEGEQPALDLHLLGGTALFVHGVPHPLPRRRRVVELLAYLTVAASQGATRDELLETFWPNTPLDEAAPRFHVLAHTLRALLAEAGIDEALQRRGSVYQLDSRRIRVDALDF